MEATLEIVFGHGPYGIDFDIGTRPLGLISKIEHGLLKLDTMLIDATRARDEAVARLPAYQARDGMPFREQTMLEEKRAALADLEAELEGSSANEGNDKTLAETWQFRRIQRPR